MGGVWIWPMDGGDEQRTRVRASFRSHLLSFDWYTCCLKRPLPSERNADGSLRSTSPFSPPRAHLDSRPLLRSACCGHSTPPHTYWWQKGLSIGLVSTEPQWSGSREGQAEGSHSSQALQTEASYRSHRHTSDTGALTGLILSLQVSGLEGLMLVVGPPS